MMTAVALLGKETVLSRANSPDRHVVQLKRQLQPGAAEVVVVRVAHRDRDQDRSPVAAVLGEPHPSHLEVRVGVDPGPDRRASRHRGEPAPDTQAAGREPSGTAGPDAACVTTGC